jgi:D-proline reductase (dithiol) PrdB
MVRHADLPEIDRAHLLGKACEPLPGEPFVHGPPLSQRRVAIVTTAGLHPTGQPNFDLRDTGYRVIPGNVDERDLVMSHSSVNFDRSGFQQDVNVVFPLERLRELAEAGEIGSVADCHYALNGAGWEPHEIEPTAAELAGLLQRDKVDAAVLVPV